MVKTTLKLSGEERREAIIRAVRKVFAERGFHGTTTRALADAAGVSEALLFKHFPNKEALYSAMQLFCCNENDPEKIDRIKALEPSTSTLVLIVHLMVSRTVGTGPESRDDAVTHHRLMLRSMIEDGEFARLFYERTMPCWISKVESCLQVSIAAGEAVAGPVFPNLGPSLPGNWPRPSWFRSCRQLRSSTMACRAKTGRASRLVHSPRFGCKR